MSGIGLSSIGLSTPFGIGTPDPTTAPPTIRPRDAAYLDPITRDYVLGTDGEYLRMPILRQRVLIALGTLLGSSSVQQSAGLTLPTKIDSTFERRAQFAVRSALAFLVTSRELRIDAITVTQPIPGRAQITVAYTDLHTGENDSATK
jgi:phage baseplate assembly protein W